MKKNIFCALLLSLGVSQVAQAQELKLLLKQSLVKSPELLKARSDLEASKNRIEQAKSMHYPTVNLKANQFATEWHRDKDDNAEHKFEPSVEVGLNLYSFGAIEAEVDKNRAEKDYYQQQYIATKDDLAYQIGNLYIDALSAKEQIAVLKKSLKRHDSFIREIRTIVEHDKGRRSELVQAQARKILVEQKINEQQRVLQTSLNKLVKYTHRRLTVADLQTPFKGVTKAKLKKYYSVKNYNQHPTYLASQAELRSKDYEYIAAKKKNLPSIDLVSNIGRDDRTVSVQFNWGLYNRQNNYNIREKANIKAAASQDLDILVLNLKEMANQALIDMTLTQRELNILGRQSKANIKVADFYRLQFNVGRKSLFEVLTAENDLSDVRLGFVNAKSSFNHAVLDYLHSQGTLLKWMK